MEPRTTLAQLLTDPGSSALAILDPSYGVVVNYKMLAEQVESLASQLLGAGFKAGDVVAIILPNGLEFLVVLLALTRARLVASPINRRIRPRRCGSLSALGRLKRSSRRET